MIGRRFALATVICPVVTSIDLVRAFPVFTRTAVFAFLCLPGL